MTSAEATTTAAPHCTVARVIAECVLLTVLVFFAMSPQKSDPPATLREFMAAANINEISITTSQGSYKLINRGTALLTGNASALVSPSAANNWILDENAAVNPTSLNELLSGLWTASFNPIAKELAIDKLGLSPAHVTLSIVSARDRKDIKIGLRNEYLSMYYAQIGDTNAIYMTTGRFVDTALKSRDFFLSAPPDATYATVPFEGEELQ